MKRICIFGVVLALVALTAAALSAADRKGMIGVGVGGGLNLPMGDFSDLYKLGFRGDLSVGYFVTNEIAIGASGAFNSNKGKDEYILALQLLLDSSITDVKIRTIEYGAWGKYFFKMQNDKIAPYVKAGVGGYSLKETAEAGSTEYTNKGSDVGINGGVGAMFSVSPTASIFVEGAFHNIFTEGSSTNYITAKTGVAFMLGGSSAGGGGTAE